MKHDDDMGTMILLGLPATSKAAADMRAGKKRKKKKGTEDDKAESETDDDCD
jgi:hypothetical protein